MHWEPHTAQLRANGANNHPFWRSSFNDETANHHVSARLLNKCARTDVAKPRCRSYGRRGSRSRQGMSAGVAQQKHAGEQE
jgi:hypothetical protein